MCIASDRRFLRLLSIGGASLQLLCVPGPLLCLAAHSSSVMLLYHAGVGESTAVMCSRALAVFSNSVMLLYHAGLGESTDVMCPRALAVFSSP